MTLRKYGTGDVLGVDRDGSIAKTAKQGWTEQDEQELREETPEVTQDDVNGLS